MLKAQKQSTTLVVLYKTKLSMIDIFNKEKTMATDKTHQLLSLLLLTKDDLEMRGGYLKHQMDNINKAISIVEDSIRYRRAFFTIEE